MITNRISNLELGAGLIETAASRLDRELVELIMRRIAADIGARVADSERAAEKSGGR